MKPLLFLALTSALFAQITQIPASSGGGGGTIASTSNILAGDGTGNAVSSAIAASAVVTLTGTQTLQNKTLYNPIFSAASSPCTSQVSDQSTFVVIWTLGNCPLYFGTNGIAGPSLNAARTLFDLSGVASTALKAGTAYNITVYDPTSSVGTSPLVIRAGAGDTGSTKLFKMYLNDYTTERFSITRDGDVVTSGAIAGGAGIYAQNSGYLGWSGRSRIYSGVDGSIQLTNNSANGFTLLQFGLTTSSAPALKPSSTTLQVRLADDSGYAPMTVKDLTIDNQKAASGTYALCINTSGAVTSSSSACVGLAPVASVPWYPIGPYGGGITDVMAGSANQGTCHAFYNYQSRSFTQASFNVTTIASGTNGAGIGIYDSAGTTLVAYTETATVGNGTARLNIGTTGKKSLNWSGGTMVIGGTLTLTAGKYFACASSSSTVLATDRWNNLSILNLQVTGDNGYVSAVTSGTTTLIWASTMPSRTFSGNGTEPIQLVFE